MNNNQQLPVAVIGAGPVGLAAAAQLVARGVEPLVLDAGGEVGANVRRWQHVRVFSPWEMNVDERAVALLEQTGWQRPAAGDYPTGAELVERYLEPLSRTPALADRILLGRRVLAVGRLGLDKLKTEGRESRPFEILAATDDGVERHLARAVIDASGTVATPNPLGAGGLPAPGEDELAGYIAHGHPDMLGRERARYTGRRTLVVGTGHSALGALLDLEQLRVEEPGTDVVWAVRAPSLEGVLHPDARDQLERRGRLAADLSQRLGELEVVTGFSVRALERRDGGIVVSDGERTIGPVDQIVAATGYRPDLSLLRELRVEVDPWVESPPALAPLIDPNVHSCGSVPPHGVDELSHPEPGVFVAGMKSYGRAPTFLMRTGYEQVRSIADALAGDWEAARRVELVLPETGVCSLPAAIPAGAGAREPAASCCGGQAEPSDLTISAT